MAANMTLSGEDSRFFSAFTEVLFSNPFSDEPSEVERLTESWRRSAVQDRQNHYLSTLVPILNERIAALDSRGLRTIRDVTEPHRRLVEQAFLFYVYSRHVDDMDKLIRDQLRNGNRPVDVPFAGEVLFELETRGFTSKEALRYFALFYQLRRAFYFIAHALVGDSPCMKALRRELWDGVFSQDVRIYERHLWNRMEDFSTLLLGETGTGKGAAAAALGRSAYIPFDPQRNCFATSFTQTFIAINLSQFPESLIESELFGHRKGAFTGAIEHRKGVLELCNEHGALFLDEIGDVSVPVQIKLLKVLQERTFRPVGSASEQRFGGRVIAASNRSLDELRGDGRIRDDFYYRLSSHVISVPSLRQRIEESPGELPGLATLLVTRITGDESSDLTSVVLAALERDLPPDYAWPGNVRELEQAVRRILLTRHYPGDDLATDLPETDDFIQKMQRGDLKVKELLARYCTLLYERFGSYEEVARRADLDPRTVKKYVDAHK